MANWISLPQGQNLDLWQEVLKKELKTENIERVISRSTQEGLKHSLLATAAPAWFDASFKQAALSYTWTRKSEINWQEVPALFAQGVWDFILDPTILGLDETELNLELKQAEKIISLTPIRLWVNHPTMALPTGANRIISADFVYQQGGASSWEMGVLLDQLISWAKNESSESVAIALHMESTLFQSIAKLRAMKAITQSAFAAMDSTASLSRVAWMARPSWREFTALDASNNILRNATSLVAGYLGGAHVVESLPYDLLLVDHNERARIQRVALTSQLVLASEASLADVMDPASGSYFIEELTRSLGEAAWDVMQQLSSLSVEEKKTVQAQEAKKYWLGVVEKFRTRRIVQTGVNDFPLASEEVQLAARWKKNDHVRLAREFEDLRLGLKVKPIVAVVVVGDYAALQARLNFSKNYFEILGVSVLDAHKSLSREEAIIWLKSVNAHVVVWVSSDEEHSSLTCVTPWTYIAGKTTVDGCRNIFAGQNVLATLREFVEGWKP